MKFFTSLNLYILFALVAMVTLYLVLTQISSLPALLAHLLRAVGSGREWLLVFMVLLPLALTMTLIWKVKEAVLHSVFEDGD
jgi:hypothetical protein